MSYFHTSSFKKSKNVRLVDNYLDKLDWKVKENANMGYSLQGMHNYTASKISEEYWASLYPKKIYEFHENGDFHIHDLGELATYCCGWDLQDLLRLGFTGVASKISCRPAKHFDSALGQIVNFIYTLQGESAGAISFSNFDTLLAPFIRADNLTFKQVKQNLQTFVYNLNIPTRVGFQTPFSNLSMDMNPPVYLASQPVVIGGELQNFTYGELKTEMDLLNSAFAEVMLEGDGNGRVFTFPIPTYNITKDFDWQDERYIPIWEMSAKYGIPYFANYVNSDMDPSDARSMCCRLRLDNRELYHRGGGLFGSNPLTGSIGVVTINLPRIGFTSNSKKELFGKLTLVMDLAKESLEFKRRYLQEMTERGLYPYTQFYLKNIYKRQGSYWSNHFSTIGLVGMNELLVNFLKEDIATQEGRELALQILEFMRTRIQSYQTETGNLYNLEATPAEGTSYRLAKKDQQLYPKIIFANSVAVIQKGAQPYYTNSSQLPVGFTKDLFEALTLQDELQSMYTGGTVMHGFLGERVTNVQAVKNLIRAVTTSYTLPYFTLTPTFSICCSHGYISGEHIICPQCLEKTEVYSRVVGYLRPIDQWNDGKREEFSDRLEFVLN